MGGNSEFWQELSRTVMLRGEDWRHIVDSLPGRISALETQSMLQSADQLARCNMRGVAILAGMPKYSTPDPETLSLYLPSDRLTAESVAMQWLYQFFILEALAKAAGAAFAAEDQPMANWPTMFLDMYVQGLHFMTYMSALLCLFEEGVLRTDIFLAAFPESEEAVRKRVEKTTANLYQKALDYGESFRRHGVPGLLPRLWDKVARYTQLRSEAHRIPNFESMQDSARDLLGYSAIAWSLVLEIPAAQNIQKVEVIH